MCVGLIWIIRTVIKVFHIGIHNLIFLCSYNFFSSFQSSAFGLSFSENKCWDLQFHKLGSWSEFLADKFTNSCLKCCFAKFTILPLAEIIFSLSIFFFFHFFLSLMCVSNVKYETISQGLFQVHEIYIEKQFNILGIFCFTDRYP